MREESESTGITREQLYQLVWSEPARTLAPRLGLSDVGLAKLCRRHDIPKPGVGHWEKVRHGKRVRRPPLPEQVGRPSKQTLIACGQQERPMESARVTAQRNYESEPEHRIRVPATLRRTHPLVSRTREALEARTKGRSSHWPDPRARPAKAGCLDVHVSRGAVTRALKIFEAVIRASGERGFEVRGDDRDPSDSAVLTVLGEPIRLGIQERCRQEERPTSFEWRPTEKVLVPTGQLVLHIDEYVQGVRKSWSDGSRQNVEECLNDVMVALVKVAEGLQIRRAELEAWRRQREESEERRRAEERKRAEEEARRKHLQAQAAAWSQAETIRAFVTAVQVAGRGPDGQEGEDLEAWIRWASDLARRLDPLQEPPMTQGLGDPTNP